jgi:hypothetical protein
MRNYDFRMLVRLRFYSDSESMNTFFRYLDSVGPKGSS